jgi:hypothetical protein
MDTTTRMDITTYRRGGTPPENMVLYLYVETRGGHSNIESFMAKIYEADQKGHISNEMPLFHGYGTRYSEWKATLSFLDVWLGCSYPKTIRKTLESWIFETKAAATKFNSPCREVYLEIRYQNGRSHIVLSSNGSPRRHTVYPRPETSAPIL